MVRKLGYFVVVVAGSVGCIVGLYCLFSGGSQHQATSWSSAITATSSIALVVVTAVLVFVTINYVHLTGQLVRVQSDFTSPARAIQREVAANNASVLAARALTTVNRAISTFPQTTGGFPDAIAITEWDAIGQFAQELGFIEGTLPSELRDDCASVVQALWAASRCQANLYSIVRDASISYMQPDPQHPQAATWGWRDVQVVFEAHEDHSVTWDDLVSGKHLEDAKSALESFGKAESEYLAENSNDGRK
jgi:hypothetical protein